MGDLPVADVIELQQLLARYAVGMTKDDVDAVVEVFTPDGTYSRLRRHLRPRRLPRPWSPPPPRGCSWSARRRSSSTASTGTGEQPLCFVEQTTHAHAHRLVHRHLPPHRPADGACRPGR